MKIAVLDNDIMDEAAVEQFHSYGEMLKTLFNTVSQPVVMDVFKTIHGQYPKHIDDYDIFLLSGSREDAFGDAHWINTLRVFVKNLIKQHKKMIGVCFGHQLIAHCLGANVGRADVGWGLGRMSYHWQPAIAERTSGDFSLLVCHQDQVKTLPEGATVIASSDFCPIAAYTVGDHIICFQGHPEFTAEYVTYLANKRRSVLGEKMYRTVIDSTKENHDGRQIAQLCIDFLTNSKS